LSARAPAGRPGPADRLQVAGAKSGRSAEAGVTAAHSQPSAAPPSVWSCVQRVDKLGY